MAKKKDKKYKKLTTKQLYDSRLKSAERRCKLLGTDDLKLALQDANMWINRMIRAGELDEAEFYAQVSLMAVRELRRRE